MITFAKKEEITVPESANPSLVAGWSRAICEYPEVAETMVPRWTKYIPHEPFGKQLAFLRLPHMEAFYGGAGGGGKSDALLMAALMYVDCPGYSAIIFRKSLQDLQKSGALIDRSIQWLGNTEAEWNGKLYSWRFPSSGAPITLAFSYLDNAGDKYHHQSAEYHYIGFEETSQFYEEDYTYLFSRLRRRRCPLHKDAIRCGELPPEGDHRCKICREYAPQSRIPLRIRCASNPGGTGHFWLKNRFSITNVNGRYIGKNPQRPFIPAFYWDNPYLDADEYKASLSNISDPVTREQIMKGDWGISASGRFKKGWARYYSVNGDYIILGRDRKGPAFLKRDCRLWMICDPAASAYDIWKRSATESVPGEPSWTVVSSFFVTPGWDLVWWKVHRCRVEVPGVLDAIRSQFQERIAERDGQPEFIGIEDSGLGIGVYQMAANAGFPVRPMRPMGNDKIVRATDAMNRMERGKVWLPEQAPWLEECETELFTWTGHPMEQADQIDTLAYAALEVSREAGGIELPMATNSAPMATSTAGALEW